MLPLDQNTVPTKESRVGAVLAYVGTARQLIEDTKNEQLKALDRSFNTGWACSHLQGGPARIGLVSDAVLIVHAAAGCTVHLLQWRVFPFYNPKEKRGIGEMQYTPGEPANWYGSNLSEEDVIFGAEEKLAETIKMADRKHHPEAIFITTSCAAGIIGDDLEGVVKAVQPEVHATLVPIRCEPLKSKVSQQGHDALNHAILKYLVREPKQKQPDLINVITAAGAGIQWLDRVYLMGMLAKAGIRTNVVPDYTTTEQFRVMSEAVLTVCLCPTYGEYLAKGLEQRYGIPYIRDVSPWGIAKTEEWLRLIARHLHKEKEVEQIIAEEKALVMPQVEALRKEFQGIKVFVSAGQTRVFFMPHMLVGDFGMKLVGLNPYHWDETAIVHLEELGKAAGNLDFFIHVGDAQAYELANYIRKMDVDLGLIHRGPLIVLFKLGTPVIGNVFIERHGLRKDQDERLQMGFRGVVSYGKYISRVLRNPSYSKKLSQHTRLPYKQSWYEADAFSKFVEVEG
ncbi:MAG: hypothetical protein HY670_05180 [Chloroflexi bacterium]|nr:hypothetical protein [Chloroflexota bacterium]